MVALPTTTPMHKAAIGGDIDTVLALLQEGTPTCIKIVFPSYEKGVTALHLAARSGRVEVVKALLGAGACVNGAVESCMTSMTCADPTPLQEAAYEGHVNVTRALLAAGAAWALRTAGNRVNWRHRYGEDKYAAIHFAAYENHSRVVRALVQAGADVNQRSERYGFAPIHIASWRGYVGVITMLIRLGADVQIADYIFGSSPLSRTSSLEAVETLLAAGSNPNWFAKSDDQIEHTPIAYQVMRLSDTSSQKDVERSRAISEALLREGADPNIRAPVQGIPITLLAYASMSGLPSMVSLFLDAGLDPDEVIEHWCMSSLHLAAMGGHAEVLRVLLSAGANKNIRNKKGSTPLHTACTFGQMICVHTLLQWKCDPTAVEDGPDGSGYTPADLLTFPQHWSPGGGVRENDANQAYWNDMHRRVRGAERWWRRGTVLLLRSRLHPEKSRGCRLRIPAFKTQAHNAARGAKGETTVKERGCCMPRIDLGGIGAEGAVCRFLNDFMSMLFSACTGVNTPDDAEDNSPAEKSFQDVCSDAIRHRRATDGFRRTLKRLMALRKDKEFIFRSVVMFL